MMGRCFLRTTPPAGVHLLQGASFWQVISERDYRCALHGNFYHADLPTNLQNRGQLEVSRQMTISSSNDLARTKPSI